MLARRYCLAWPHIDVVTKPNVILKTLRLIQKRNRANPKRLFFVLSSVHQSAPIVRSFDRGYFSTREDSRHRSTVDIPSGPNNGARGSFNPLPFLLFLAGLTNSSVLAFELLESNVCEPSFFFSFHSPFICVSFHSLPFSFAPSSIAYIRTHVLPFALASSFLPLSSPSSPLSLSSLPS